MKVYGVADLDGLTEAMVMAPNLVAAAAALGVSVAQLRRLGWASVRTSAAAVARRAEGRPVYRAHGHGAQGHGGKWTADRTAALAQAARAALRAGLA